MDSSDLTKIAGKAVVGMNYTSAAGPASALPKAKAFVDDFKKKFSKNPEPYAAEAYDATAIAIKAIEAVAKTGKVSREAVSAAVRKVKLSGITGDIEFDGKGDRQKAPVLRADGGERQPREVGRQQDRQAAHDRAPGGGQVAATHAVIGGRGDRRAPPALPRLPVECRWTLTS